MPPPAAATSEARVAQLLHPNLQEHSMVLIVLVRHGERLDEADPTAWRRIRTDANRADPPLTATGVAQSLAAGDKLASLLR